jgi:hypothetical protein
MAIELGVCDLNRFAARPIVQIKIINQDIRSFDLWTLSWLSDAGPAGITLRNHIEADAGQYAYWTAIIRLRD